jgi:hypothetical protein
LQGEAPVGTSRLELPETKQNLKGLLEEASYTSEEIELLSLYVIESYSEEGLVEEYAERIGEDASEVHLEYVQGLIDKFHGFMSSFGKAGARELIENGFENTGTDGAMLVGKKVGGIDLNPNKLEIETQGSTSYNASSDYDITIFQDPSFLGFDPIIINITPITNLLAILGAN